MAFNGQLRDNGASAFDGTLVEESVGEFVDPSSIVSAEAIGSHFVDTVVFPQSLNSAESLGSPSLDQTVDVTSVSSLEALGVPSADQIVHLVGIASVVSVGTPTLDQDIGVAGVGTTESLGSPSLDQFVHLSGLVSGEASGVPTFDQIVHGIGLVSGNVFGTPVLDVSVTAVSIPSGELLGSPLFSQLLLASGISSQESVGSPELTVVAADADVDIVSIDSSESFGSPVVTFDLGTLTIENLRAGDTVLVHFKNSVDRGEGVVFVEDGGAVRSIDPSRTAGLIRKKSIGIVLGNNVVQRVLTLEVRYINMNRYSYRIQVPYRNIQKLMKLIIDDGMSVREQNYYSKSAEINSKLDGLFFPQFSKFVPVRIRRR